jgi:hypothetical protein
MGRIDLGGTTWRFREPGRTATGAQGGATDACSKQRKGVSRGYDQSGEGL